MPDHPQASESMMRGFVLAAAWLGVGLPLAWGVATTIHKALALFR